MHAFSRLVTPHQWMHTGHTHSHSMGLYWSMAHVYLHASAKRLPRRRAHSSHYSQNKGEQDKMASWTVEQMDSWCRAQKLKASRLYLAVKKKKTLLVVESSNCREQREEATLVKGSVQLLGPQNGGEGRAERVCWGGIQLNACSDIINLIRWRSFLPFTVCVTNPRNSRGPDTSARRAQKLEWAGKNNKMPLKM